MKNKHIKLGFILLFIWCLISAFSRVLTGSIEQQLDPIYLGFYVSGISSLFFIIFNMKQLKQLYLKCIAHHKDIIWINITTVGCWLFLLYPLKFVEPSLVSAVTLAITPIATIIASRFIYQKQKSYSYDYTISTTLLLLAGYLIYISFTGNTMIKPASTMENFLSVICYFIVGIALAFNNIYAKRLSDANFTPVDTLTVRFLLLAFLTGFLCLFIRPTMVISPWLMKDILLAALSLIIIPQLVYQVA